MIVVTKQKLIATVAERWQAAHQRRGEWFSTPTLADVQRIHAALVELPADAPEAAVIALTGDNRWTQNRCHECGVDSEVTVGLAREIHHPTDTTYICLSCLQDALALAQSE
ncbi:MAG: hypothetical protein R3C14_17485 [Caldilineaceae bacterium]